jgi:23S rRNA (adenine2503-C2)-methyltransferase
MKWIYQQGADRFEQMSNISKALRQRLAEVAELRLPEVVADQPSADGTRKWVLRIDAHNSVETVFIPDGERGTLCVSSQAGCTLACSFCSTARQGFNRNLTSGEIIAQLLVAQRALGIPKNIVGDRPVTNVVMMGMGEPLLNLDNVVAAMGLMQEDNAFGISKRRITLSTAGVVPGIYELRKHSDVTLAISLHAPNDELRNRLVPINRKYPIAELMEACRAYVSDKSHKRITVEYVMLKGVNDSLQHAKELVKVLRGVPSKINLIPFNPFPGAPYECSDKAQIERFRDYLIQRGFTTVTRKTRGDDIAAACGQLVGEVNDKTARRKRIAITEEKIAS